MKKQKIKIKIGKRETTVSGLTHNEYGIHRSYIGDDILSNEYTVTHIASGYSAKENLSYTEARALAMALDDVPIWDGEGNPPQHFIDTLTKKITEMKRKKECK